jgi:FtsH-binding integral membrane protein
MSSIKHSFAAQSKSVSFDQGLREYMVGVFGNMCLALVITGLVSFFVYSNPNISALFYSQTATGYSFSGLGWVVALAPVAFVFFFSYKISSMSTDTARVMLWVYSALMGLSLSTVFIAFTGESIAKIFFITASMFASMCIYGYTTKRDLTGMGSFMLMGLIGVLLASLVNFFLPTPSPALGFVVSILSVIIFTGLTAYNVQRITNIYWSLPSGSDRDKAAVMGALNLYLDFINIFLALLRLFGNRR